MHKHVVIGLTLMVFSLSQAALGAVTVTQTERDIRVSSSGPDGYSLELDRRYGTFRQLWDGEGGDYATPEVRELFLGHPSLNPASWDRQLKYAMRQVAVLKAYPAVDGDTAIDNPVIAWESPASVSTPEQRAGAAYVNVNNPRGQAVQYEFHDGRIVARIQGNHGQYRVVLLLPIPDGMGRVQNGSNAHWLRGAAPFNVSGQALDFMSAYRARAVRLGFPSGAKDVFVEMQEQGRTLDRAVQEKSRDVYVGLAFTVQNGEAFELSFPAANGLQHDTERVLAMQPFYEGVPTGSTRGFWMADNVDVPTGGSLTLQPVGGASVGGLGVANPRIEGLIADVTRGDFDFYWKQTEPNNWATRPGYFVFPKDAFWKPITVTRNGESLDVDTRGVPPGIYRVRVRVTDPGNASAHPVIGDLYVAVGQSQTKRAVFAQDNRTTFMRGEALELTTVGSGGFRVVLVGPTGREHALGTFPGGTTRESTNFRLETSSLRPGNYQARAIPDAASDATGVLSFLLVDPERPSTIAMEDLSLTPAPFSADLTKTHFGGTKPSPWKHGFAKPLAEIGLTAMRRTLEGNPAYAPQRRLALFASRHAAGLSADNFMPYSLAQPWFDSFVEHRIGYWQGVQERALSFTKVTVLDDYINGLAQRMAIIAQQLRRYPTFGGVTLDVDVAGTAPELGLKYAPMPADIVSNYQQRVRNAQQEDFAQVMDAELRAIQALPATEQERARTRLWIKYLTELHPRTNARYQQVLKSIDPALKQTSNTEYNHAPVLEGQYPPTLYQGLDFTSMEAWGDMRFNPLQDAYWAEMAAAVRDLAPYTPNSGGPVWMQSQAYEWFWDDQLQRNWWEVIGNGGDGVGYAANIFGLNMYGIQSHVPDERRDTAVAMGELVQRLGPLFQNMQRERDVALLYSFQEGAQQGKSWYAGQFSNSIYVAFYALSQFGVSPGLVYEESIRAGLLNRHKVLMLAAQTQPLPPDVMIKIAEFQSQGGVVVCDTHTTVNIPGMIKVDALDFSEINQAVPTEFYANERYQRVRAGLAATLPGLAPQPGWSPEETALLYWFKSGEARHLIALNNRRLPTDQWTGSNHSLDFLRLEPHLEKMYLRDAPGKVYNVLTQQEVPVQSDAGGQYVELDFSAGHVQLLTFLPAAVEPLAVDASAAALGRTTTVRVTHPHLLPVTVEIVAPSGEVRTVRHTTTNKPLPFNLASNDAAGSWWVRATEWVSGQQVTATLSVTGSPSVSATALVPQGDVIVYDDHAYAPLLENGARVTVVLDAAQTDLIPLATDLQARLRSRGVNADLWVSPPIVEMPVDWTYSAEDTALRNRVLQGEVIGKRWWRGNKDHPSWELKMGYQIARNVIFLGDAQHNRWIRAMEEENVLRRPVTSEFPGASRAVLQHVWAFFDARFGAVVIGGRDVAGLQKGVERLLGAPQSTPSALSLTRQRFLDAMGFDRSAIGNTSVPSGAQLARLPISEQRTVEGEEPLRPNISNVVTSPDGHYIAVSMFTHGNNVTLLDNTGRVVWARSAGKGENVMVRTVTNTGHVALIVGRDSEVRDVHGNRVLQLGGKRIQWLSPNGQEYIALDRYQLVRGRVADQSTVWAVNHGVPPREENAPYAFIVDEKGAMIVGPSFDGLADGNGGVPQNINDVFLLGLDARTGSQRFKLPQFFASGVSFSRNGRYIGAAKKRFYVNEQGNVEYNIVGANDSLLVLLDSTGQVRFQERANVQLSRTAASDNGMWVVGVAHVVMPEAYLGLVGGGLERIRVQDGSVRDVCVMGNGMDVALTTFEGSVQVFDGTRPLWRFDGNRDTRMWCTHPRMWLGSRWSHLGRMTKRGVPLWAVDLADHVLDPAGAYTQSVVGDSPRL